jgi:hypothetical protein
MSNTAPGHGYRFSPEEMATQVKGLAALGDRTSGLVSSAGQLAQRLPQLGTAPPALHLAARLREAAGQAGLTGEISTAHADLTAAHTALGESLAQYLRVEERVVDALRNSEGATG